MLKNIFIIPTFFLVFISNVNSQPSGFTTVKDINAVSDKIKTVSAQTKTIQSEFKQFKHLSILSGDVESSGSFLFKAENKVIWKYTLPYSYLIVMNSGKMWIKSNGKVQTFDTKSNRMFKETNDLLIGLLKGQILENKDFKPTFFENKTILLVVLVPQKPEIKEFITKIYIYFDKKDFTVSELKMFENANDYTLIKFFNKNINIEIPDSKFTVK